jgi:hypothetical protein
VYDPTQQHGYKAVFLTDDGGGDADLDEATRWLAAKQLPDGTPVGGLSIVDNHGGFRDPFTGPRLEGVS